jgi:hypothetical protein
VQRRASGARSVDRVGAPGSVDQLDRWVQVMDLWSITLCVE